MEVRRLGRSSVNSPSRSFSEGFVFFGGKSSCHDVSEGHWDCTSSDMPRNGSSVSGWLMPRCWPSGTGATRRENCLLFHCALPWCRGLLHQQSAIAGPSVPGVSCHRRWKKERRLSGSCCSRFTLSWCQDLRGVWANHAKHSCAGS